MNYKCYSITIELTLAHSIYPYIQRVKQFYQDANLGPTIKDVEFTAIIGIFTVNPSIKIIPEGWKVQHNGLKKVRK